MQVVIQNLLEHPYFYVESSHCFVEHPRIFVNRPHTFVEQCIKHLGIYNLRQNIEDSKQKCINL